MKRLIGLFLLVSVHGIESMARKYVPLIIAHEYSFSHIDTVNWSYQRLPDSPGNWRESILIKRSKEENYWRPLPSEDLSNEIMPIRICAMINKLIQDASNE